MEHHDHFVIVSNEVANISDDETNVDWDFVIDRLKRDKGALFLGPDILENLPDLPRSLPEIIDMLPGELKENNYYLEICRAFYKEMPDILEWLIETFIKQPGILDLIFTVFQKNQGDLDKLFDLLKKETRKRRGRFQAFFDKELNTGLREKIKIYFPAQNLFLLPGNDIRLRLELQYKKFYEREINEEIFKKLVDLPFRLIVSVNPDQHFVKVYDDILKKQTGKPLDHYTFNDKSNLPAKGWNRIPDNFFPVYYTLMGDISDNNSLVLTHEDLFRRMRSFSLKSLLPREFDLAMSKIQFGIFLGFRFDMWYYQILINFLDEKLESGYQTEKNKISNERNSGIIKFSNNYKIKDTYCKDVCNNILKVDFSESSLSELTNELYTRCKKENILRSQMFSGKPKIYISYSHEEEEKFIEKREITQLYDKLKEKGYLVVFDEKVRPRGDIYAYIEELAKADKVVIIFNENYIRSRFCMYELARIFTTQKSLKTVYPISKSLTRENCKEVYKYWSNRLDEYISLVKNDSDDEHKELLLIKENYMPIISALFRKTVPQTIEELIESLNSQNLFNNDKEIPRYPAFYRFDGQPFFWA